MSGNIGISGLKCNYLTDPVGVDTIQPILSWALDSDEQGQRQTAYRIMAASSPELLEEEKGDLWDSGKVISDCSIHVAYEGQALRSRMSCYWKVCIWDRDGALCGWSDTAFFEMGLIDDGDWKARWICASTTVTDISPGEREASSAVPAPLFRKSIVLNKKVIKARAYMCGLGYHELYINGAKAGDDVLSPAFTKYDETLLYNTYDITNMFTSGENTMGVILGNGMYNCLTPIFDFRHNPWRHHPKLLMQAHIMFEDGEEFLLTSDTTWRVSTGPIMFDGLRNGEFYDARLEKPGWNRPGYDDSKWGKAMLAKPPGGRLKSFGMVPIRVTGVMEPVSLTEVKPGLWIYDIGQNISGWARLKVAGPAGTEIKLRYAEKLDGDGLIDQSNLNRIAGGEFQTDKYTLKGAGIETWEPRFTYHGFQYVEMTGFPGTPSLDNLYGCVVHTDFDTRGRFECSNSMLNSIQHCSRWSTLNNYHGVPTDCPHREKNGWTGDALVSAEQVFLNFNPMTAYIKWLNDFKDVQRNTGQIPGIIPTGLWGYNWGSGPAWDSALILIPWYMYVYCGDLSIIQSMYDTMDRYMGFMTSMADDHIVDFGLGDWCPPGKGKRPDDYRCPVAVTDTAYYYVNSATMSRAAALLGKEEDSKRYHELAEGIKNAFRNRFFDSQTGIVTGDSQTSYSCALYQGLINDDEKEKVLERLVEKIEEKDRHIDCGILGAKYIMQALTDHGRADLAYAMAAQTTYPGWGYWVSQGATTLWETWWLGGSSKNHHMFSDISAWFYKGLAGINPDLDEPGFRHIMFRPNPVEGLEWVKASHQSMYGLIECCWKVTGDRFEIEVSVPVNCHATLHMPAKYSGEVYELESGRHRFKCSAQKFQ